MTIDIEFEVGDKVVLSAPDHPFAASWKLSCGWNAWMAKAVGEEATVLEVGAICERGNHYVRTYAVKVETSGDTWWWDCDYMRPIDEASASGDLERMQSFDLVFG